MDGLIVGNIMGTHGLKGELKIRNLSDFDRFYKGSVLYINYQDSFIKVVVENVRDHDKLLLVTFKDLEDINLVEKYKGCKLYIDKSDLDKLDEGEYYYYELIGRKIYNEDNLYRGDVKEVREYPQSAMLVVNVDGKDKLIPFRKEFIVSVSEDKIIIHEIEGLL